MRPLTHPKSNIASKPVPANHLRPAVLRGERVPLLALLGANGCFLMFIYWLDMHLEHNARGVSGDTVRLQEAEWTSGLATVIWV